MAGSYAKKGSTPSKGPSSAKSSSAKRNHSILNFFQKTDTPPGATSNQARITQFVTSSRSPSSGRGTPLLAHGNSSKSDATGELFLEDKKGIKIEQAALTIQAGDRPRSRTPENIWDEGDDFLEPDDPRLNENGASVKRQKVDLSNASTEQDQSNSGSNSAKPARAKEASNGPFIDESDSEEDMEAYYRESDESSPELSKIHDGQSPSVKDDPARDPPVAPPPLVREDTSYAEDDEFANFDDLEEEEPVGEEFRERPWEVEEPDLRFDDDDVDDLNGTDITTTDSSVNACPICRKALTRLSETVCVSTCYRPLHTERQTGSRRTCK